MTLCEHTILKPWSITDQCTLNPVHITLNTHLSSSIKIVAEIIQSIVYCCLKMTNVSWQLLNGNYSKNSSNSAHRMYTHNITLYYGLQSPFYGHSSLGSTHRTIAVMGRKMTVSMMHFVFWCFFLYCLDLAPQCPHIRQQTMQHPTQGNTTAKTRPRAIATIAGASHWRNCKISKTHFRINPLFGQERYDKPTSFATSSVSCSGGSIPQSRFSLSLINSIASTRVSSVKRNGLKNCIDWTMYISHHVSL